MELPESVRNISSFAFSDEQRYSSGYALQKLKIYNSLPDRMNMPKNFFRQKTPFDYKMAFLLTKTLWQDYITFTDFEAVILYQDNSYAQKTACAELNCYCNEHLKNLLSNTDNSPIQLEHIAGYASAYISKIDRPLIEKLKSRADEYNAVNALSILNKYCFNDDERSINEDIDFCFKYLEPYKADTFEKLRRVKSVLYKSGDEYVPDIVLKSVLYAYLCQFDEDNFDYGLGFASFSKNRYADSLVEKFDRKSFTDLLQYLCENNLFVYDYMLPICRYADIDTLKKYIIDLDFDVYVYAGQKETVKMYLSAALKLNESAEIKALIKNFAEIGFDIVNHSDVCERSLDCESEYEESVNEENSEFDFSQEESDYADYEDDCEYFEYDEESDFYDENEDE